MRYGSKRKRDSKSGKIDMTPMIDCVFQLLLFFLVASHFEEQARALNEGELSATLPEAAAAMPMVSRPRELIINIDSKGKFFVGGDVRSETQLSQLLKQAQANNPGSQSVVIRGDETADWKYIARVMGLCNKADIKDYRVAVVPEGDAPEGG